MMLRKFFDWCFSYMNVKPAVVFILVIWLAMVMFALGATIARAQPSIMYGKLEACMAPAAYVQQFKANPTFQGARVFTKSETAQLVAAVFRDTERHFDVDTIAVVYLRTMGIVVFGKGAVCEYFAADPAIMRGVIKSALGQGV